MKHCLLDPTPEFLIQEVWVGGLLRICISDTFPGAAAFAAAANPGTTGDTLSTMQGKHSLGRGRTESRQVMTPDWVPQSGGEPSEEGWEGQQV